MSETETETSSGTDRFYSSERAKAFIDAVVAIAMTLLILPLMESVSHAKSTSQWLSENYFPLVAFALSFVIVGMFWMLHHRVFATVERVTSGLLWLNLGWLLTIVWMPVATALTGQSDPGDRITVVIYIGSMALISAVLLVIRLYLRAHPELRSSAGDDVREGIAVDLAMITLFAASLGLALAVPALTYFPLFLMFLTGPMQALYARLLGVRRQRAPR